MGDEREGLRDDEIILEESVAPCGCLVQLVEAQTDEPKRCRVRHRLCDEHERIRELRERPGG